VCFACVGGHLSNHKWHIQNSRICITSVGGDSLSYFTLLPIKLAIIHLTPKNLSGDYINKYYYSLDIRVSLCAPDFDINLISYCIGTTRNLCCDSIYVPRCSGSKRHLVEVYDGSVCQSNNLPFISASKLLLFLCYIQHGTKYRTIPYQCHRPSSSFCHSVNT